MRGALLSQGIFSRLVAPGDFAGPDSALAVLLPAPGEDVSALSARCRGALDGTEPGTVVVLAGHGQTLHTLGRLAAASGECAVRPPATSRECAVRPPAALGERAGHPPGAFGERGGPPPTALDGRVRRSDAPDGERRLFGAELPAAHEIVIVGEPYETLIRLAVDDSFRARSRGMVLVGARPQADHFRTPALGETAPREGLLAGSPEATPRVSLITGIGCDKRCGYCTMGAARSRLYRGGLPRQSRPWPDVLDELRTLSGRGVDRFQLLADQFLAADPARNRDLSELTRHWARRSAPSGRKLRLTFTVAPGEVVRNGPLLAAMASAFDLYPRLSVDSLDGETLRLLDLDFSPSTAIEALSILGSLGTSLRLNYIFIRPGMTPAGLGEELSRLTQVAEITKHLSYYEKLLLAHDVFSRPLDVLAGTPVAAKGVPANYQAGLPLAAWRVVTAIQEAVAGLVGAAGTGEPLTPAGDGPLPPGAPHPLTVAIEAGLRALGGGAKGRVFGKACVPGSARKGDSPCSVP